MRALDDLGPGVEVVERLEGKGFHSPKVWLG
jgi:hypothetical protein